MSSAFPFDVIDLIIDIIGENNDTDLLKELSLVSHSFHQICSKHLFATIVLQDVGQDQHIASSKKGFVKLLGSRPDVVKYIRKLTYICNDMLSPPKGPNDHLLSTKLPKLLRTISHLNHLKITTSADSQSDWNTLDSSLTSAFLYLMHLPTINHIDLSSIENFPLSNFTSSPNLHRLDIEYLRRFDRPGPEEPDQFSSEIVILSETTAKIREFHTLSSIRVTTKLLLAKRQDGLPAFDFMDLRRLFICLGDERNIQYLLQNATSLEKLHLSVGSAHGLLRLRDILSSGTRALKALGFTVSASLLYISLNLRLAGLCEGLEAMAGHNMLEALSIDLHVDDQEETEDSVGSEVRRIEEVLVKPGWSALKQVSFKITLIHWGTGPNLELYKALEQTIPDKYLNHLSKLESVTFDFSVTSFSDY